MFCDTLLNDALGMFGVRVACAFGCIRADLLHLAALYPNPYAQANPSQRVAPTTGGPRLARLALTPSCSFFPAAASLRLAARRALLTRRGSSKRSKDTAYFESRPERPRSRARLCGLTAAHAYGARAERRLGYDRGPADRA